MNENNLSINIRELRLIKKEILDSNKNDTFIYKNKQYNCSNKIAAIATIDNLINIIRKNNGMVLLDED